MAGEKDIVTEFVYSKELFEKIMAPEKKFYTFPEGLHEVHNDFESDEFMDQMILYTNERLERYVPGEQCPLGRMHEIPSYSKYYFWRNWIIRIVFLLIAFYFLRRNKWKLLKYLLNV